MTRVKPPRKVKKGMLNEKEIQGGREGNRDQITQEEHVLSGVEKSILAPCCQGCWLKSNGALGGK